MAGQYNRLSIAEKQAVDRERMHEAPMPCPADCGTSVLPADLLGHVAQRCPGPREPGPAAKWVTLPEAVAAGVTRRNVSFWARRGDVRCRGERGDRQYLLRDLVLLVTTRRRARRR